MADETLNLVARLRDEVSGTARKIRTNLKAVGDDGVKSIDGIINKVASLRNVLVGFAGIRIAQGIIRQFIEINSQLSRTAANAEEVGSKFNVVFGAQAERARQQLEAFGAAVGRSNLDLQTGAASIQDILVPMGLQRDAAADLSLAMTELAVDVASFNNSQDADVLRDFSSALVGQTETVRKYGIVLLDADTKQEAYRLGLAEQGEEVSQLSKLLARVSLIYQGTEDAQGDALRTAGSFTNTMKALRGEMENVRAEIGERTNQAILNFIAGMGGVDVATDLARDSLERLVTVTETLGERGPRNIARFLEIFNRIIRAVEVYFRVLGEARPIPGLPIEHPFAGSMRDVSAILDEIIQGNEELIQSLREIESSQERFRQRGALPNDLSLQGVFGQEDARAAVRDRQEAIRGLGRTSETAQTKVDRLIASLRELFGQASTGGDFIGPVANVDDPRLFVDPNNAFPALDQLAEGTDRVTESVDEASFAAVRMQSAFSTAFAGIIQDTLDAKDVVDLFVNALVTGFSQNVASSLFGGFSFFSRGGFPGGSFGPDAPIEGAARGRVFSPGPRFAVVNEGPFQEAALPVFPTRFRGENVLGVAAAGGGGGGNTFHVTINAVDSRSFLDLAAQDPKGLAQVTMAAIEQSPVMRSRFGIRGTS